MRTIWKAVFVVTLCVPPAYGQTDLTEQQRIADLNQVAAMFAKNYGPYEWKRDVLGVDLLRLNPWMQAIHKETDLDFEETLESYVASLNDAHSYIYFPSNFTATLPLTLDVYDGKVLIDSINRTLLPSAQYPFGVGDEVVAIDGVTAQDAIASLRKYYIAANQRSTDRFAAQSVGNRVQNVIRHAGELPDTAVLTIRLAATGGSSAYSISWNKRGIPITSDGVVPSPGRQPYRGGEQTPGTSSGPGQGKSGLVSRFTRLPAVDDTLPSYMTALAPYMNASVSEDRYAVLGFGGKFPIYSPPPGFVLRRGGASSDFFLTGTFPAGGLRIGLLRIPHFQPTSASAALQQLDSEMAYFNANTDGLVVDVTRNSGGVTSFTESILQRLIPAPFRTVGFEIRATQFWLALISESLTAAQLANAPPQIIQNYQDIFNAIQQAFAENRGRTIPVSFNSTGSLTLNPLSNAYKKPILVLADETTASCAEMFTAIMQDNQRAPIFGWRTMGAGGTVVPFDATTYTGGTAYITLSLMNRGRVVQTPDFPPTPYIENVGVRPDISYDSMTRANLMSGWSPFVQAFTNAIVDLVHRSTP